MPNDEEQHVEEIEAIYDALDSGDASSALEVAEAALEREGATDPVLCFLTGVALLELDRAVQAENCLRTAVRLDPEDAEFRAQWSLALHRLARFEEAEREAEAAWRLDADLPESRQARALALERKGHFDEADDLWDQLARADGEPEPPPRMTREAFERAVRDVAERISPEFRRALADVSIDIEPVPDAGLLTEGGPPLDPGLLGLLDEPRSGTHAGRTRLVVFQRNVERASTDRKDLNRRIRETLEHELAAYLDPEGER